MSNLQTYSNLSRNTYFCRKILIACMLWQNLGIYTGAHIILFYKNDGLSIYCLSDTSKVSEKAYILYVSQSDNDPTLIIIRHSSTCNNLCYQHLPYNYRYSDKQMHHLH